MVTDWNRNWNRSAPSGTIDTMMGQRRALAWLCREKADLLMRYVWPRDQYTGEILRYMGAYLDRPESEAVFWRSELWSAAVRGAEVFVGRPYPAEYAVTPAAFWYPEKDLSVEITAFGHYTPPWWEADWGINSMALLCPPVKTGAFQMIQVSVLTKLPEEIKKEEDRIPHLLVVGGQAIGAPTHSGFSEVFAGYEFMRQSFVERGLASLPRPERRRLMKAGIDLTHTHILTLRKTHKEEAASGSTTESEREYHCQWLRRGHWRRLHDPRKSDGAEVTYVRPALCGPEDKPFKGIQDRIVRVTR